MKTRVFVIGLVLIGVAGVLGFYVVKILAPYLSLITLDTATTLLKITIPLLISIFTIYYGRSIEKNKSNQEKLREKKVPIYEDFISHSLKLLLDKDLPIEQREKELLTFIRAFTPKMIIWADDSVIKAWSDFRYYSTSEKPDAHQLLYSFEKILLAIRKDLGHKNSKIADHEILKSFINDIP